MKDSVMFEDLIALLAVIFVVGWIVNGAEANAAEAAKCLTVAHRGFSSIAPENTVVAARKAMESGADGSEFDVYAAADGALVVMHDDKVDRTTNGKGKIGDKTLAEIKQLDAGAWKNASYVGERVPTLEEMLTTLKGTHCKPVIEIKGGHIADKVVAAVRAADMVDHAWVISFNKETVNAVRTLEPRLPCAWLCGQLPNEVPPSQAVDWLVGQAQECKTDFVDLNWEMLSADTVSQLHQRGLTVWVWTVDDPKAMDRLIQWGVTGITTNCLTVLQSRLKIAAERTPATLESGKKDAVVK
jgi:glycerophosphoryl diester phosphodiesterase